MAWRGTLSVLLTSVNYSRTATLEAGTEMGRIDPECSDRETTERPSDSLKNAPSRGARPVRPLVSSQRRGDNNA